MKRFFGFFAKLKLKRFWVPAVVLLVLILLLYFLPIGSWWDAGSKPTTETPSETKHAWYEMNPLSWVAVSFCILFGLLLLFTKKKKKPKESVETDAEEEESEDEKKKSPFDRYRETWHGGALIYTVMVIVVYLFITRVLLYFQFPLTWKWLWEDHRTIFFLIPATILVSVLAFTFKRMVVTGLGIATIIVLLLAISNDSGISDRFWKWLERRDEAKAAKAAQASVPTEYQLKWSKSPGFKGGDSNVTEEQNKAEIIQNRDLQFDIVVYYTYYSGNPGSTNMTWNKAKDPEKGEWYRQNPPASGKWYLKETSKNHFVGEWMDDRYPGKWMPLSMYPAPATR